MKTNLEQAVMVHNLLKQVWWLVEHHDLNDELLYEEARHSYVEYTGHEPLLSEGDPYQLFSQTLAQATNKLQLIQASYDAEEYLLGLEKWVETLSRVRSLEEVRIQ